MSFSDEKKISLLLFLFQGGKVSSVVGSLIFVLF